MLFAQRIKKQREKLGLTPSQLSSKIGVPLSTYIEWEGGRQIRGEDPYPKLACELKISLSHLITGKEKLDVLESIDSIEKHIKVLRSLL